MSEAIAKSWDDLAVILGELEEEEVLKKIDDFLKTNPSSEETQEIINACCKGMEIVGDRFEEGEYFVGDLIFAGEVLQGAIDKLKPVLAQGEGEKKIGTMVLGTVYGDLHDIGKNIFKSMIEAAGFEVHDLGIDVSAEKFIDKINEVKPDIVAMSGVLTLAVESMKDIIERLEKAGLRDKVKVQIGGAPINKDVFVYVGADAYSLNAAEGVKVAKGLVS